MMRGELLVAVVDGQGGGMGRGLVVAVKKKWPSLHVRALGTNSLATAAMLRAGADDGGFKRHFPVRLTALIAVAAAQVAVFRYLKRDALGMRRVDAKLDTRHREKPRQHIGEGFLRPSHRSAPAASPSPWRSRNQAPSQPLHCRRQE